MYAALRVLLAREIEEVAQTVGVCSARLRRRQEFQARNEDDILADSLAACLHSLYTGLENIFKSIAEETAEGA